MSTIDPCLARACDWLDGWRTDGRGVTIGLDGSVTTWWLPDADISASRRLLDQLDRDASLKTAIRAVVHAEAILIQTDKGRPDAR